MSLFLVLTYGLIGLAICLLALVRCMWDVRREFQDTGELFHMGLYFDHYHGQHRQDPDVQERRQREYAVVG